MTKSEKITKPKDPLEGMTLEMIVTKLVENYGWDPRDNLK